MDCSSEGESVVTVCIRAVLEHNYGFNPAELMGKGTDELLDGYLYGVKLRVRKIPLLLAKGELPRRESYLYDVLDGTYFSNGEPLMLLRNRAVELGYDSKEVLTDNPEKLYSYVSKAENSSAFFRSGTSKLTWVDA